MQAADPPTFHPTVWPAEPPTTPDVTLYELARDVGNSDLLSVRRAIGTVELPSDFALRELFELGVASIDDVIGIAQQWGLASGFGAGSFEHFSTRGPDRITKQLDVWTASFLVHPDAVEIHLRMLRTLSRHLLAFFEGAGDEAIVTAWVAEGFTTPQDVGQAWSWWENAMNRGLATFAVHVRTGVDPRNGSLPRPSPNLYNACCLQLAQYLTRNVSVSRCANTRCGKPFTKQRGLAKYGQHRSIGVRYCTPQCAKAQSERDRRARRREEKGQGQ